MHNHKKGKRLLNYYFTKNNASSISKKHNLHVYILCLIILLII